MPMAFFGRNPPFWNNIKKRWFGDCPWNLPWTISLYRWVSLLKSSKIIRESSKAPKINTLICFRSNSLWNIYICVQVRRLPRIPEFQHLCKNPWETQLSIQATCCFSMTCCRRRWFCGRRSSQVSFSCTRCNSCDAMRCDMGIAMGRYLCYILGFQMSLNDIIYVYTYVYIWLYDIIWYDMSVLEYIIGSS